MNTKIRYMRCFAAMLAILTASNLLAGTLIIPVETWWGAKPKNAVKLTPLVNPYRVGTNVVWSPAYQFYPTNGLVTISNCSAGLYRCTMDKVDGSFDIGVPYTNIVVNALDLTTNLTSYTWYEAAAYAVVASNNITVQTNGRAYIISATGGGGSGTLTNALYVAPWGNDASFVRGDISHPARTLYDWDGTNRSGVCALATNGDTIVLMGTNYAAIVPLSSGVTLRGMNDQAWLMWTNVLTASTNTLQNDPDWPFIAIHGDNVTVERLNVDARDGSYVPGGTDPNFITLFNQKANAVRTYIWTNSTKTQPSVPALPTFVGYGATNQYGKNVRIDGCTLIGNVDVFYLNWVSYYTVFLGDTNDPAYLDTDDEPVDPWLDGAQSDAVPSWVTNNYYTPEIDVVVRNCTLISYWDTVFASGNGMRLTCENIESHSMGLGGGSGWGHGPVVGPGFTDINGRYFVSAATNLSKCEGLNSVATDAVLLGTRFYMSNALAVVVHTNTATGLWYDVFKRKAYAGGATNLLFNSYVAQQTQWPWSSITNAPWITNGQTGAVLTNAIFSGITNNGILWMPENDINANGATIGGTAITGDGFFGNGSGLTNLAATNLTGTVPLSRLPSEVLTNGQSAFLSGLAIPYKTIALIGGTNAVIDLSTNYCGTFYLACATNVYFDIANYSANWIGQWAEVIAVNQKTNLWTFNTNVFKFQSGQILTWATNATTNAVSRFTFKFGTNTNALTDIALDYR